MPTTAQHGKEIDRFCHSYSACGCGINQSWFIDYCCRIDKEWVADATVRGGLARFINHSCDPNCYTKIFEVEGTRKIGIYAKKNIGQGQELAYDYKVGWEKL